MFIRPKNGSKKIIKLPKRLTKEMAFLAGMIIGDGNLGKIRYKYRILIEMVSSKILSLSQDKILKTFSFLARIKTVKKRIGKRQSFKISFQNKVMWVLFNQIFEIPSG